VTVVLACNPIVKRVLPMLTKLTGRSTDAITLGPGLTLIFKDKMTPDQAARLSRHEAAHRRQGALFMPVWARGKWNPLKKAGEVVASGRFLATYLSMYMKDGYENHAWEVQARNAENGP
jgi:hypothetical protein